MAKDEKVEHSQPQPLSLTVEDIIKIVQAAKQNPDEQAALIAKAATLSRPEQPSNPTAPLKSVFNPLGDRDNPKPALKCLFTMNDGIELEPDQLNLEEIELLNLLEPGAFPLRMADDSMRQIRVVAHTDDLGGLNRINLEVKGLSDPDVRTNLPSLTKMLRSILGAKASGVLTMADYYELATKPALAVA